MFFCIFCAVFLVIACHCQLCQQMLVNDPRTIVWSVAFTPLLYCVFPFKTPLTAAEL